MNYKSTAFLLLISALFLWSCGDKADFRNSVVPATGARVKFYHAAPDAAGVDIYVNDQKFSGVNTVPPAAPALLTYFNSFPNQDYALVTPGTAKVKVVMPASTTAATESTLATTDLTTQADTYYSVFLYGTAPTYNTLTLTDNLTVKDPAQAYIRLVNLVAGTDAAATYDLAVNGTVVVSGIAPLKGSATFIPIPAIAYATTAVPVQIRPAGASTVIASTTVQPYAGRFYTLVARGIVGGTSTKAITLSISTNR